MQPFLSERSAVNDGSMVHPMSIVDTHAGAGEGQAAPTCRSRGPRAAAADGSPLRVQTTERFFALASCSSAPGDHY